MGELTDAALARVPQGLTLPGPLHALFAWVEDNGLVHRGPDGDLYGTLSSEWPTGPGTNVLLRGNPPDEVEQIAAWLGPVRDGLPTLWPFCRTGSDGSQAALWLAPDGRDLVVHLGSGSGSLLTCVLAEDAVDFLRLLAIGYDEICWNEDWHEAPQAEPGRSVLNEPYRHWVESTFDTTIPATATAIVPFPAEMGDEDTEDVWCRWVNAATG